MKVRHCKGLWRHFCNPFGYFFFDGKKVAFGLVKPIWSEPDFGQKVSGGKVEGVDGSCAKFQFDG